MVTIQPLKVTRPWNPSGPCCNEDLISAQEDLQLNGGLHSMIQASRFCFGWLFFFVVGPAVFFFSELSAFNSLLKDMDCQNGRKQWSQHHDMSAQLVFV